MNSQLYNSDPNTHRLSTDLTKDSRKERRVAASESEFLAAYDEHSGTLFRHCLQRVRDRGIAEDIVQETFSRTWLYLSQGKKVDCFRAFLFRIANNVIIDGARQKQSSSLDALMEDDGFEPVDESIRDPIDAPALNRALKLLGQLDESYRSVITMCFMDELSTKEAAKVLGVPENVVCVRLHRGIERLVGTFSNEHGIGASIAQG